MEPLTRLQAMQRIGKWLSEGVEKDSALDRKITRLCGSYRIWTNSKGQFVEVGMHGRGKPIIMIEKRPVQAKERLFSPS